MQQRDENQTAALAVAGFSLIMLVCVMGALLLPSWFIGRVCSAQWITFAVLLAAVVGLPVLLNLAQRDRIRKAAAELGGTVTRLRRLPFWRQGEWPQSYQAAIRGTPWWRGVLYEVEFTDLRGIAHRATCRSGFLRGVQWLEDSVADEGQADR